MFVKTEVSKRKNECLDFYNKVEALKEIVDQYNQKNNIFIKALSKAKQKIIKNPNDDDTPKNRHLDHDLQEVEKLFKDTSKLREDIEGLAQCHKLIEMINLEDRQKKLERWYEDMKYLEKISIETLWQNFKVVFESDEETLQFEGFTDDNFKTFYVLKLRSVSYLKKKIQMHEQFFKDLAKVIEIKDLIKKYNF